MKPGSKASVKGAPGALLPVRQCGIPRRPLVKSPQLSESGKRKKRLGAKATAREKGGGVWRGWDDSLRSGFGRALPQAYRALSLVPGGGMGSDLEGHALQCTLEGRTDLCARQVHWTDDAKVERKRAALFGITCVAKLYEVGFSLVGLPQLPRRGAGTAADYHNYIIAFERVMKNRGLGK